MAVFDGRSHKIIQWIHDIELPVKDEHWSNRTMSLGEVAEFLGQIRQAKKRVK
jgi:hypothetical protein